MKIIIIGVGKVGSVLAENLAAENHDLTVVDTKKQRLEELINTCDVIGVCGNGASYDILSEAGAKNADLVIACTPEDEVNILACFVAKKLGAGHTIARVRNPEYEKQLRYMGDDLGLSMIINPEKATAREISRVLRFPTALKVESFAKGRVELIEYIVGEASPLNGVKLSDLKKNVRAKVLICAVARNGGATIPSGDFVIEAGDTVYITSSPSELVNFFAHLGVLRAGVKSTIIAGASSICYHLAKELIGIGIKVTIVDSDLNRCRQMSERLPDALVIQGDATDGEILGEEGIAKTDAFVALTGLDESNIILSMYAIQKGVGKVVTKINRRTFFNLVAHSAVQDTIVSASAITAEQITQYVRTMNSDDNDIVTLHPIVNGLAEAVEFRVAEGSELIGRPIMELDLRSDVLIAVIARKDGEIIIPSGRDILGQGDSVIIVTTDKNVSRLSDIVRRGGTRR
ncbi:MAG: Trk system potassium transporter TrkA [Clostridia bacterium]|nr:Trk system potassium transporter TrkA [Clostridia bacterium]